jgi:IPT/TIG domain
MGRSRWIAGALVALTIAPAAGAAVTSSDSVGTTVLDGKKVFPIVLAKGPDPGSTTPSGNDALDEVVSAGVTFLKVGPATTVWNQADIDDALANDRAAAARGIHTWINLATLSRATPGSAQDTLLHTVVGTLKGDASGGAIGMWKGADEPLWSGIQPTSLQFAYCLATSRGQSGWCAGEAPIDSDHLWVTIEAPRGTAEQMAPYSAVTDIHGVDHYPVTLANPDPDLHTVGTWTQTVASVTPNKAVWTTLQVCASGSYNASTGQFVLPTRQQERYMIYDAILNGARNLAFYGGNIPGCWNASDTARGWNWTFWDGVLKPLIQEINASSPIAPALVNPGSSRSLSSSDGSTQVMLRDGASGDIWVIAARSGAGSQAVTISGLPATVTSGAVYTENRTVAVTNGAFTDTFGRWDVHVYRFSPAAQPPPSPPRPSVTSFAPTSGPVGTAVTITGTGLSGTSAVTFAGSPATYTVVSDTQLTATVPAGAATGPIAVTAPGGTATTAPFTVSVPVTSPSPSAPPPPATTAPTTTTTPAPAPGPASVPPAAPKPVVLRLLAVGASSVPAVPHAGRPFTFRLRVATSLGAAVRTGRVTCVATLGTKRLKPTASGWRRGLAFCSWKLPTSARGKTLRGVTRVNSRGLTLSRTFSRRVR